MLSRANPPWRLIPNLLYYIRKHNPEMTVCVPVYTKATWYKLWKSMLLRESIIVPRTERLFLRKGKMVIGKHPWQFTAIGVLGIGKAFDWDDTYLSDKQNAFEMLFENDFDKDNKYKGGLWL